MDLDGAMAKFVEERTIPIFGIASAQGFADALPGWHPKELMPRCESVIVLGHPLLQHPLHMEERTFIANRSWWDTQRIFSRQIATWKGELFGLLDGCGLGVASFGVFRVTTAPTFSYRLAQVEAGVGVYGRAGACINPEYGCYYRVGVLLTEAQLTPTNRDHLDGFDPCEGCSECGKVCPIRAIDVSKEPGAGPIENDVRDPLGCASGCCAIHLCHERTLWNPSLHMLSVLQSVPMVYGVAGHKATTRTPRALRPLWPVLSSAVRSHIGQPETNDTCQGDCLFH